MMKKSLILYQGDGLVMQSDEFNDLFCNIFGHVAVSRMFLFLLNVSASVYCFNALAGIA